MQSVWAELWKDPELLMMSHTGGVANIFCLTANTFHSNKRENRSKNSNNFEKQIFVISFFLNHFDYVKIKYSVLFSDWFQDMNGCFHSTYDNWSVNIISLHFQGFKIVKKKFWSLLIFKPLSCFSTESENWQKHIEPFFKFNLKMISFAEVTILSVSPAAEIKGSFRLNCIRTGKVWCDSTASRGRTLMPNIQI